MRPYQDFDDLLAGSQKAAEGAESEQWVVEARDEHVTLGSGCIYRILWKIKVLTETCRKTANNLNPLKGIRLSASHGTVAGSKGGLLQPVIARDLLSRL